MMVGEMSRPTMESASEKQEHHRGRAEGDREGGEAVDAGQFGQCAATGEADRGGSLCTARCVPAHGGAD